MTGAHINLATKPLPSKITMTAPEAARWLDIGVKTFKREVRAGRVKYLLIGKRQRFREIDLMRFLEVASQCAFSNVRARPTGGTTSRSVVVGFEQALAQTRATSRTRSR